ncbi:hypothetical protein ACKWTF_014282 [Chironomus riparius]
MHSSIFNQFSSNRQIMWKFLIHLGAILFSTAHSANEVKFECKTDSRFLEENYCWLTDLSTADDQVIVTESSFNLQEQLKFQKPINIILLGNESYPEYFPKNFTRFLTGVSGFIYDDTSLKYIQRDDFTGLASPNPLILHLRSNEIEEIPFDTFYDLTNLLYLDISSNKIKSLASNLLINSIGLHSLSISGNDLTELHQDLLINCPQLYDLTAEFNQIQELHEDLFRNNPNMKNNFGTCDVIFSTLTPDDKDFDEVDQRKAMKNVPKFQKKIEKVCRE